MSRPALKTIRLLIALALFLAGVIGHGLAMAEAPMPGEMAGMAMTIDGGGHGAPCTDNHCGAGGQPCCLMGQCLLGVTTLASFVFPAPVCFVAAPSVPMALTRASPALPFRPPAWL